MIIPDQRYDAVLVGAGIMSATLAVLLHEIDPQMSILIVEKLQKPAMESSAAENNAGTGHAANCELNYTPLGLNGVVNIEKAISINNAFEQSLEFWSSLVEMGKISAKHFLNIVPHISFVWGEEDVAFLEQRYQKLKSSEFFKGMEWTSDDQELNNWIPLVMQGRNPAQPCAATRINRGTDIDFSALTNEYLSEMKSANEITFKFLTEVKDLFRDGNGYWRLKLKSSLKENIVSTPFVFLGAGGGAITLLQKSGIPESLNYGGFPVSGQWLTCSEKNLIDRHNAKVYGKAKIGAPPMSVPHLDTRWIKGKRSLLFGPFAGITTKFLKHGSNLDLFGSITKSNLSTLLKVGIKNVDLIQYLLGQVQLKQDDRIDSLKEFLPFASKKDWELSIAGQRVQIIKKTSQGATLQMGTEVVCSQDGSLAALLGASPGASTAVSIMLEVLQRCSPLQNKDELWKSRLIKLLPYSGNYSRIDLATHKEMRIRNNELLGLP